MVNPSFESLIFEVEGAPWMLVLSEREGLDLGLHLRGTGHIFMCLFSSPRIFRCFLLVKREGFDLVVDL